MGSKSKSTMKNNPKQYVTRDTAAIMPGMPRGQRDYVVGLFAPRNRAERRQALRLGKRR